MTRRIRLCATGLAFGLLAAAGCSFSPPVGQVTGKVTLKGEPVTAGDVNLYMKAKGIGVMAPLDDAGRFTIPTPIEVGTYEVYIAPPQSPEAGVAARKSKRPVPVKYWQATTSGLTAEVKEGPNELQIDLKD